MKEKLKRLEKLAREWLEFSEQLHRLKIMYHKEKDLEVRCFMSNHNSVDFRVEDGAIEVAFFKPTVFRGFTFKNIDKVDEAITIYSKFLDKKKREYKKRAYETLEKEKQEKIEELKIQLAELERTK